MGRAATLLCAVCLASSQLARVAGGVAVEEGEERLPGWLGEVPGSGGGGGGGQSQPPPGDTPWIETLSWSPRAFLYHGFLTPEECAHIRGLARPRLERSQVVDAATGASKTDDVRTSSGVFLETAETEVVKRVEARVAAWAGVPVSHQEQLQVLQYGLKQQYSDHWDFFEQSVLEVRVMPTE
jgi:prolyl 4-hydroxylase